MAGNGRNGRCRVMHGRADKTSLQYAVSDRRVVELETLAKGLYNANNYAMPSFAELVMHATIKSGLMLYFVKICHLLDVVFILVGSQIEFLVCLNTFGVLSS